MPNNNTIYVHRRLQKEPITATFQRTFGFEAKKDYEVLMPETFYLQYLLFMHITIFVPNFIA